MRRYIFPNPRTLRILLLLLVWMVAGAIVNIAVARSCVGLKATIATHPGDWNWRETTSAEQAGLQQDGFWHPAPDLKRHDTMRAFERPWPGVLETQFILSSALGADMRSADVTAFRMQCGWPCLSMEQFAPGEHVGVAIRNRLMSCGTSPTTGQQVRHRLLWPGFAINTLFYSVLLRGTFAVPFALRRRVLGGRIKRGLCPRCAYDMRGRAPESTICPECGTATA